VPAFGADFMLSHKNASALVNITNAGAGVVNWSVDGVNHLSYQSFYYRIGNTAEALVQSISSTPTVSFVQVPNTLSKLDVTYANSLLSVQTLFQLTGSTAGSGKAGLSETITIKNLSGAPLDFHFFQYSDFNLTGVTGGQSVQFSLDALLRPYQVTQTGGTTVLTETVNVGSAGVGHYEASTTAALLSSLNDGSPTTLSDAANASGGNANFAYQWDIVLDPNETLTISKLMSVIVPEPSVATMLLAAGALWKYRARKSARS
jgi:hypothetical protein